MPGPSAGGESASVSTRESVAVTAVTAAVSIAGAVTAGELAHPLPRTGPPEATAGAEVPLKLAGAAVGVVALAVFVAVFYFDR